MSHLRATMHDLHIRPATDEDDAALRRLAILDSADPLGGEVLMAIVGDRPWAALSLADGRSVADPFVPSASAVEMLRLRARHLAAPVGGRRRAGRRILGAGRLAA
jgi:hypothetical protein